MWDEIAAAVMLDRTVATATSRLALDIATDHGATLSWPAGNGPRLGESDVTVVHAIDEAKLEELFVRLMQGAV